jgi:hypothetical protein
MIETQHAPESLATTDGAQRSRWCDRVLQDACPKKILRLKHSDLTERTIAQHYHRAVT